MACPANPPPPDGFRIWRRKPVPKELADWAVALCNGEMQRVNYGTTWGTWYTPQGGAPEFVTARKDYHTWTNVRGRLVTGICISGITLYEPIPTVALTSYNPAADTLDTPDPNAAVFDVQPPDWGLVALTAGAGAAIVALFLWAINAAGSAPRRSRRA